MTFQNNGCRLGTLLKTHGFILSKRSLAVLVAAYDTFPLCCYPTDVVKVCVCIYISIDIKIETLSTYKGDSVCWWR